MSKDKVDKVRVIATEKCSECSGPPEKCARRRVACRCSVRAAPPEATRGRVPSQADRGGGRLRPSKKRAAGPAVTFPQWSTGALDTSDSGATPTCGSRAQRRWRAWRRRPQDGRGRGLPRQAMPSKRSHSCLSRSSIAQREVVGAFRQQSLRFSRQGDPAAVVRESSPEREPASPESRLRVCGRLQRAGGYVELGSADREEEWREGRMEDVRIHRRIDSGSSSADALVADRRLTGSQRPLARECLRVLGGAARGCDGPPHSALGTARGNGPRSDPYGSAGAHGG